MGAVRSNVQTLWYKLPILERLNAPPPFSFSPPPFSLAVKEMGINVHQLFHCEIREVVIDGIGE
jgi:hypothetical protein